MLKVYLSSTRVDLLAYREAVGEILRAPLEFSVIDSYDAATGTVRESCLEDVSTCQVYVGIFAWRYGHVPEDANPEARSITELEYLRARETTGMARFLFMLDPAESWPGDRDHDDTKNDPDVAGKKIKALRDRILSDRAVLFKAQPSDLAAKVLRALTRWKAETGGPAQPGAPGRPGPVSAPRLRLPQHAVVGRTDLVQTVLDGLEHGRREFAFVYLAGVGKTAIAAELIRNKAVNDRFPDGVLWAHLGPDPDVRRQLRKWAAALGLDDEQIDTCAGLEDLSAAVIQAIGQRRLLLVVDDVWNTETGASFKLGGEHCAYVVTTRHPIIARELMPTVDDVITVPKLGIEDGLRLLAELAPHAAGHAPGILKELVRRVDGLPIALVLIGNMLKAEGDNERAIRNVEQILSNTAAVFRKKKLAEFVEEHSFTLGEVIEASYTALGKAGSLNEGELSGDQLRQALEALSVLRPDPSWFTTSLAERIMETPAIALDELADAGLIEEVRYPSDDEQAGDDRRYTMHRVVAEYLRTKLPSERCLALNHLAADYYLERLRELERAYQEGDATSYSSMYRYENPEWQDCQDNWLYYFAQTGYDREASLSFLHVWFDGFWWWSCFTDEGFDFCDQLLLEWEHRLTLAASASSSASVGPESNQRFERRAKGLELLRRFKRAYPKETQDRGSGSWPEVASTIRTLRSLSSLDGEIGQLTQPSARHVRALTDIFLAEAERFGGGDIEAAAAHYREAQALFRADRDDWNVAWALYHLADMLGERGRHDETLPLCEEALAKGRSGGDHEVVALSHRVLGDAAFAGADAAAALRNYRLALEYAYRFQVEPRDPDDYTIQFYGDMTRSLAERLLRGSEREPELAREIALGLRRVWTDHGIELPTPAGEDVMRAGTGVGALAAQLFPAPLEPGRRQAEGETYAQTVRDHLQAIGA